MSKRKMSLARLIQRVWKLLAEFPEAEAVDTIMEERGVGRDKAEEFLDYVKLYPDNAAEEIADGWCEEHWDRLEDCACPVVQAAIEDPVALPAPKVQAKDAHMQRMALEFAAKKKQKAIIEAWKIAASATTLHSEFTDWMRSLYEKYGEQDAWDIETIEKEAKKFAKEHKR